MKTSPLAKKIIAVAAAFACASALVGCSGGSVKGGETTCAEFAKLSDSDKSATAKKFLEEQAGTNITDDVVVASTVSAVTLWCAGMGTDDSPIKEMFGQ